MYSFDVSMLLILTGSSVAICMLHFFLPSFSLADFKNHSKIFLAVDRDVTTFCFPLIPVGMTSSPKWLSSFILTYFSMYGVSPFKYSFNFSHKSVMVICLLFCAQYLMTCVKASTQAYIFWSSSLHFSRVMEAYWNAFFFFLL